MSTLLEVKKRENFQGSGLTKLREEGYFPAIVYGKGKENDAVYVNEGDFFKVIKEVGRNGVISLNVGGTSYNVVLQDYQQDPIKNHIVHADFLAVDLSSEMTANVRVELEGEAAGAKEGGVVQQPLYELAVTAKVSEFPERILVNISELKIGETITVGDIRKQYSFTIAHEDEEAIVSVLPPAVEKDTKEETATEEAAETAE
ncbi:50S ribosomal protein L25/general stress protein Ctc [Bacillus xiapuensis]|uniref:50S ribosomal protein L25/general stress protein Ctc n=1 Tax=Bacillus xiapuensis TaxID=2014075 RepID=UPI000C251411|nr:50S ribosomal protein L25/general stress protein Ctc [Bacillus xiapuensis]